MALPSDPAVLQRLTERYDALPECIRAAYTFAEWAWMPDRQKNRLEEQDTEPDEDVFE